jgi:hypothetical protein
MRQLVEFVTYKKNVKQKGTISYLVCLALLLLFIKGNYVSISKGSTGHSLVTEPPRTRWVLVCLVDNIENGFVERVRQLDAALQDDGKADLVIFHSDFPTSNLMHQLKDMSSRKVEFHHADTILWTFPDHFDPYMEDPNWAKRSKWGYHQVNISMHAQSRQCIQTQTVRHTYGVDDQVLLQGYIPPTYVPECEILYEV